MGNEFDEVYGYNIKSPSFVEGVTKNLMENCPASHLLFQYYEGNKSRSFLDVLVRKKWNSVSMSDYRKPI